MAVLIRADDGLVQQIVDDSYPIWNEGLSADGYARWNALQRRTAWGERQLWRVALVEPGRDGRYLASAKWYDLRCQINGESMRVLGIGAVFTPPHERGRGAAADLIQAMMAAAAADGYSAALLFSEIGAAYYERLGFRVISRDTLTLSVTHKPGAPAALLRAGEDADLPHLVELHRRGEAQGFVLPRTIELMKFAIAKRRFRAALAPLGSRVVEFFVSEEGHRAVSYVLISRGPSGNLGDGPETMWLEACGDRDPSGARVGAMLQALYARTPSEVMPPLRAWLPEGWVPPQMSIAGRAPADDIMMIQPLGATKLPDLDGKNVAWWHADLF